MNKVKKPRRVDWRENASQTDFDPDDELLDQTPPEVVAVLGFDPKDVDLGDILGLNGSWNDWRNQKETIFDRHAPLSASYSPDQPRDKEGKFASQGESNVPDRIGYGAWITPDGKWHPVDYAGGHRPKAAKLTGLTGQDDDPESELQKQGAFRVVHGSSSPSKPNDTLFLANHYDRDEPGDKVVSKEAEATAYHTAIMHEKKLVLDSGPKKGKVLYEPPKPETEARRMT